MRLPSAAPATLASLGFTDRWAALLADVGSSRQPMRVVRDDRGGVLAVGLQGERRLSAPGAVTGDWLAVADDGRATVLDRVTQITRPRPTGGDQILAANVDLVAVTHPAEQPLHRRRLERGLVLAWESGAQPVVVLTKIDLVYDVASVVAEATASAPGVDVVAVSALTGEGIEDLHALLSGHQTMALIGASGAGKSSVANALLGEDLLDTGAVRDGDAKGRHTTTRRELVQVPSGGLLLDTPGLRALTVGAAEDGIALAFADVEQLGQECRFADCSHLHEPGCAVLAAVQDGTLPADRYEGWRRIQAEAASAALRADRAAWRKRNKEWGRAGRIAMAAKRGLRSHDPGGP